MKAAAEGEGEVWVLVLVLVLAVVAVQVLVVVAATAAAAAVTDLRAEAYILSLRIASRPDPSTPAAPNALRAFMARRSLDGGAAAAAAADDGAVAGWDVQE